MKKIVPILMQLPLMLVVISSFLAGIYAAAKKIQGVTFAVPVILGIVLALYFYGRYLENKLKKGA